MKLSVSLPDEDVAFIDEYVARHRSPSRSAAIHDALNLLREVHLEDAYTAAFEEWDSGEDASLWDGTAGDGLGDAER
ncbi:antitoxin MazE9 [Acrocarpospora phusangensis]|uniref:Antitoxin MazE9 n=1 Tax=Acrocarpospora phusangensis TaxID=1070424 RepID=A0A919QGU5_9ACTN|nr:ribbon-helix-helix domain-containing protein [Acrocarpospora phusangensis]GIH26215.1 antitoxin MazE9 [Acrocarpospora phusangensis]